MNRLIKRAVTAEGLRRDNAEHDRPFRTVGTLVVLSLLAVIGLAAPAAAARPAPATAGITEQIPCEIEGVASTCTLAVTSFRVVDGVLTAVGTVTGGGITLPFQAPVVPTDGICEILDLTLGPLDLDLLGLVVHLDQVHLTIVAESGPGNLLGNLLCAVAGLLDGPFNTTVLNQLATLLNRILGLLG